MLSGVRALVVDDSAPVRMRLIALLGEHSDVEMLDASTPEQALAIVNATELDAVILDFRLKDSSGLDLITVVRERQPRALVIVLTNNPSDAHRRECLLRGADHFLDKSHHFERIADLIPRSRSRAR